MDLCSWCGAQVGEDEGFRAAEPAGERHAAFCRLEHVVPWVMQGARFEPGDPPGIDLEGEVGKNGLGRCAHCAAPVDDDCVLIVRHRGAHRIGDAFCDVEHLLEWARAGGRYGVR